jgi:hypothetical protein
VAEPETGAHLRARITLFGFDEVQGTARVEARTAGWRARRATWALAAGLIAAPIVGLVPPHAPWALGALGVGLFTARRRWAEQHTLHTFEGACPRCEEPISISRPVRLLRPHPVSCTSCRFELSISVEVE